MCKLKLDTLKGLRWRGIIGVLLVAITLGGHLLQAQKTPEELAELTLARFVGGTAEQFEAVFPFEEGRELFRFADKQQFPRERGLDLVIQKTSDEAVLLLSGFPRLPNSGDETIWSRGLAGIYIANLDASNWKLSRKIPIDEANRIKSQRLDVTVIPNQSLRVADHLDIEIGGSYGFAARLNHKARLDKVLWNGAPVRHAFGGGLLWVDVRKSVGGTLTLEYEIQVEEGPDNNNSSCFLKRAGHIRNQYFWHPFFDFNSQNDQALFDITVRIPESYRVATSVPQSDEVREGARIVRGRTTNPTFALTLLYDRDWQVRTENLGTVRLDIFATAEFKPDSQDIIREFRETFNLLARRFGTPAAGYFGVAQSRSRSGGGWHYASNHLIVAGGQGGGAFTRSEGEPRVFFGHEVAHLWTKASGPAANFMSEGWATFAEAVILRERFGAEVERRFWNAQAKSYFAAHDGKASILNDPHNQGVAYSKGAWLFAMLERAMGTERFNSAMAEFSRKSLEHPAGIEDFMTAIRREGARVSDFDIVSFLTPWLKTTSAPRLSARVSGSTLVIEQSDPSFRLPVELEIESENGKERREVMITGRETVIDVGRPIRNVTIDPDHRLLLKR